MERLVLYLLTFAFCTITYALLGGGIVDSLITMIFFGSSLVYVFSLEYMPEKGLDIPAVFKYQKTRVNIYGYIMSVMLVVSVISISFISYNLSVSPALLSLIFWFVMIVGSLLATLYVSKNLSQDIISDYIINNINEKLTPQDYPLIEELIAKLVKVQSLKKDKLSAIANSFAKKTKMSKTTINKVINLYVFYSVNSQEELTGDEIKELNKK